MKPNFALNLSFDTISLARRTGRGWMMVGEVATDSPDLAEALSYLRSKALGLSPQGFTTKLVLPESEVLYTEVTVDGPPKQRRARVKSALDGLTPYAVDELAFDMQGEGPKIRVAVVARETLEQAEDFAMQHRFNPVSFVAVPKGGSFEGEAFFGPTQAARDLIAAGETVERDAAPTLASPPPAKAEAAPAPPPPATEAVPPVEAPAAADATTPAEAPEVMPVEAAKPATPAAGDQETGSASPAETPMAAAPLQDRPAEARPVAEELVNTPSAAVPPEGSAAPVVVDVAPVDRQDRPAEPTLPEAEPEPEPKVADPAHQGDGAKAPTAGQADLVDLSPADAGSVTPEPPAAARPAPSVPVPPVPAADLTPPAFSSRRRDDRREGGARVPPPVTAPAAAAPTITAPAVTAPAVTAKAQTPPNGISAQASVRAVPPVSASAKTALDSPSKPAEAPSVRRAATDEQDPAPASAPPRVAPMMSPPPSADRPAAEKTVAPLPMPPRAPKPAVAPLPKARGVMGLVTAAGLPGKAPKARVQMPSPPGTPGATNAAPGARALTRGAERPRGKPRYLGLVLTGTLLLFLALVAAWSSFYLSRNETEQDGRTRLADADAPGPAGTPADTPVPAAPAPLEVSAGDRVTPPPPPEAVTDQVAAEAAGASDLPESAAADVAASDALPDAVTEPAPEAVAVAEPEPEPAPAAVASLAETAGRGGPMSAPTSSGQDEIMLSTRDAPPPSFDAVALPPVVSAMDVPPAPPMAPPPFGTVYSFDADGRIAAGERGVITPDGVWLIAARPPMIPPARPAPAPTTEPAAAATLFPPAEAPPAVATPEALSGFQPDTTINALRPPGRPADLIPAAPPEPVPEAQAEDDAALARALDPRLATLRPRARTAELLSQAEAGRQATAGASLVQAVATVAATPATAAFAGASTLAVPISRRPAPRPRDFSRAVAAAVAAATAPAAAPAAAAPAPRSAPAAEPDEEDEPELTAAAAAPRIPTRADVARQATFTNAINLSKINLIGIYGSSTNRYALVRTANGRYNKIKVGDRVDGGTVAAITASEVRYQKSGRMLSLQMPRG